MLIGSKNTIKHEITMKQKSISLFLSLLPIIVTIAMIFTQIFLFNDFTPHIPLLLGIGIAGCIGFYLKKPWKDLEKGMFDVVSVVIPSVSILIIVGCTISIWIASGTVPTIIYFGLNLLSPKIFLAAAMILCSLISVSLGTSWGTTATIGLALMGIGEGFNIPMYWTAGAVVSGAFFGDKISPLSDTTNLAPAVTKTHIFDHIRNMLPTTIPSMLIALFIYVVAGFFVIDTSQISFEKINLFTTALQTDFIINVWLLIPAVLVCVLAIKKVPALPSLFIGALSGALIAIGVQGHSLHDLISYSFSGFKYSSNVPELFSLLNRGGVESMSWVILLMLIALAFGGILEKIGAMNKILMSLASIIKSFSSLQITAVLSSVFINVVSGDPYLAIALPGRMFKDEYAKFGYSRLNLTRAIEEGGTLVSPLIPWNAGGAFVITALGLNIFSGDYTNLLYIPLSFACWLSPVIGIIYAYFGIFSPKEIQVKDDIVVAVKPSEQQEPVLVSK